MLEKISKFKVSFDLERGYLWAVLVVVVGIMWTAVTVLKSPISIKQYNNIVNLSQQYSYPQTQQYAESIVQYEQVDMYIYLKLMQAYQQEARSTSQLPAQRFDIE